MGKILNGLKQFSSLRTSHYIHNIYIHGSRCNLRFSSRILLCSMTVCKLKSASKRKAPKLTVSILSYMVMLRKIWNAISNKTFINCFKDADFSKEGPSMIKMIPSLDFKTSKSTQFRPCLFEEKLLTSKSTLTPNSTNISILTLTSAIRNIQHITRFLLKLMTLKRILTMMEKKKIMVN